MFNPTDISRINLCLYAVHLWDKVNGKTLKIFKLFPSDVWNALNVDMTSRWKWKYPKITLKWSFLKSSEMIKWVHKRKAFRWRVVCISFWQGRCVCLFFFHFVFILLKFSSVGITASHTQGVSVISKTGIFIYIYVLHCMFPPVTVLIRFNGFIYSQKTF